MKTPITQEKALERLAGLCSRSEQCEFDLNRKLLAWGLSSSARKEILDYLKENRYTDEQRFANSFANDKARFSAWGPYKIRLELSKRHIKSTVISEAIKKVDNSVWKEGLLRAAMSKSRQLDIKDEISYEDTQKFIRYIVSRGFSTSSATKALSHIKKRREQE